MNEMTWMIRAARACTGQGKTPATIFAGVATANSRIQLSGTLTHVFDGNDIGCYVCPVNDDVGNDNRARMAGLMVTALMELDHQLSEWPDDATLVLQSGSERAMSINRDQLVDSLYRVGAINLATWCASAESIQLGRWCDWQTVAQAENLIWLSADSLINGPRIQPFQDRVADELLDDGLIPGEGAAAVWLSRKQSNPTYPQLTLYLTEHPQLTADQSPFDSIKPYQDILINDISTDPHSQSQWYRWLHDYAMNETTDIEQHLWLARSLGCPGAASAGIGIMVALGRLNLPYPVAQSAWMIHQDLQDHYFVFKLEQGETHVR